MTISTYMGGYNSSNGQYLDLTVKISLKNMKDGEVDLRILQTDAKVTPQPRGSACIVDSFLYIFGGTNSDQTFDDFWHLDLETEKWEMHLRPLKGQQGKGDWPEKRKGKIMVPHSSSPNIFMFGGIKEITKEQNDIMVYYDENDCSYESDSGLEGQTRTATLLSFRIDEISIYWSSQSIIERCLM